MAAIIEKDIYKATARACYRGNFVQATVVNLTPVLFIPLRDLYGFSYSQFGLLILINFVTQFSVDLLFSGAVDKYGFRIFTVIAHFLCVIGFAMYAFTPILFSGNEYVGFFISTIVFSGSGGLLELLLSPIVDSIPTPAKAKAMSILHSFYAWGQVSVVIITTLLLFLKVQWYVIVLLWAIIPLYNAISFMRVPIANKLDGVTKMKYLELIKNPIFIVSFFAIIFGGASENIIAQWSSAFLERGMQLPKIVGDMGGMAGFAFMLGVGRLLYGMYGDKINIHKAMIYGSALAMGCYVVIVFSPFAWLTVLACIICGIAVSLLWPCTLVVASHKLPLAGAALFALLAAGGDMGCAIGPMITGFVTDYSIKLPFFQSIIDMTNLSTEQLSLRIGILIGIVFPLGAMILHMRLKKVRQATKTAN